MNKKLIFGSTKFWCFVLMFILGMVQMQHVKAQTFEFPSVSYVDSMKLSDIVNTPGYDTFTVTQADFYSMSSANQGTNFILKSLYALVNFKVDIGAASSSWIFSSSGVASLQNSIHYLIIYRTIGIPNPDDTNIQVVSTTDTMSVNYDPFSAVLTCDNSYKVAGRFNKMKVIVQEVYDMRNSSGIVQQNPPMTPAQASSIPDFVYVSGEIRVQKYTSPPQNNYNIFHADSISTDGTFKLDWTQKWGDYKPAAYEVEWTYAESANNYSFRNNATRIYTNNTYFDIPVAQKQGVLVWHMRMLRPSLADFTARQYGPWTDPQSVTINNSKNDSLNWDLKTSFVEDGKYKQNITYYDGLLKPKQTQTRLNTNPLNTIIGQSLFDHEGRAVIQSLPIPVQDRKNFAYLANFLRPAGASEYLKSMYDALPDTAQCPGGENPIPPLDDSAVSNRYYSPANPNKRGYNSFIPNAEGYPLTRKILAAENPERVLFEGRAGATLQLGNERETAYLYGVPLQAELNKYFGQDIGKYNYYRKTITTDNHGQDMFSIADDEGRPIASGLTNTPDTVELALSVRDLPGNDSFKSNLLPVPDTKLGLKWENNGGHFVSVESNYGLSYGINYKPFRPCSGLPYGLLPKVYFNYEIFDNCGNLKIQDSGVLGGVGYTTNTILTDSKDSAAYLLKGNHVWAKKSYVKMEDIRASVDSLFDSKELCYHSFEYFLNEEVKKAKFPCPSNDDPCEGLRFTMMRDMYPGAKYGTYKYSDTATKAFIGSGENSIFTCISGCDGGNDPGYLYQQAAIDYPDTVYSDGVAYTPAMIRAMSPQQFIDIFNDSIATALLPLHPDYCKLKMCALVNIPYCQTLAVIKSAQIAQNAQRFTLYDIFTHDILLDSNILDTLQLTTTQEGDSINQLAFEQTLCGSENKTIQNRCMFLLWGKTAANITDYPSHVQDEYYKNLIRLYAENREYRLGNKMHDGKLVQKECGPCAGIRLEDKDPPVAYNMGANNTVDTNSDATSFFNAADSIKVKGSKTQTLSSTTPRTITSANTFSNHFAENISNECEQKVDAILASLENCDVTSAVLVRLRDTLMQRFCNGGDKLSLLTPDSLRNIMVSVGIVPSGLCNSWLPNLQMLLAPGGDAVKLGHLAYNQTFYDNIASFLEKYNILNFIASDSISKSISVRLCDDYPFEQDLVERLGQMTTPTDCSTATSVFVEKDTTLPLKSNTIGVKLQYGTATLRLYLYPENIQDTNRLNDTFGLPHIVDFQNYKAQSLFHTYGFDKLAATYANRNTVLLTFDGEVNHEIVPLRYYLSIFTETQDYTMVERDEPEYLNGLGCSELKAPLQAALSVADTLNLKAGHPLFEKFLQNKLNYERDVRFSYENYEEAIRTCALTDSLLIKKQLAHFRVKLPSGTNVDTFIDELQMVDTIYFSSIHIYEAGGSSYLLLDVSSGTPKSFKEVRQTLQNRVQALGGTTETLPALGRDTLAQLLSSSLLPVYKASLDSVFRNVTIRTTPVSISYYRPGLPIVMANGDLITIIDQNASQASSYDYNHYVDSICRYVNRRSPITPIFTHAESAVSAQYDDWQMEAWRTYVNTLSPDNHNLLVKGSKPEQFKNLVAANGNTFSTSDISYQNKQYPYYNNDLYINTDPTKDQTYTYILGLLDAFGYYNQNVVPYQKPLLVPTPAGGLLGPLTSGGETRAFVCGDSTVFWINHFSGAEQMYNIFIKLPPYLLLPRDAYRIQSTRKGFEKDSITYFTLTLVGTDYNTGVEDTVEAIAYCDRSLGQSYQIPSAFLVSHSNSKTTAAPLQLCEYEKYKRLYPAARIAFMHYRDSMRNVLVGQFRNHIISQLQESLDIFGNDIKQGLTLYYYDVAGNLIKTVAPAGVKKLSVMGSDNDTINAYRLRNELNSPLVPAHSKVTSYRYNAQNKVVSTTTPDAGTTSTQYDLAGRVIFSRTAQQITDNQCTYFIYDKLSRVIETGQCTYKSEWNNSTAYTTIGSLLADELRSLPRAEVVATLYDGASYEPGTGPFATLPKQYNLKNRVAAVKTFNSVRPLADVLTDTNYSSALHYSYDVSGNVKTLVHDLRGIMRPELRMKRVDYEYDLYSGKVLLAAYNRGMADQLFQSYTYDADNRIVSASTSPDGLMWDEDARYRYYDHGPLARTSLGENRVQGVDYAYTINGWLKAINGVENDFRRDMGGDGVTIGLMSGAIAAVTPPDVFSQRIDYFHRDYRPIGDSLFLEALAPTQKELFNGNIAGIASSLEPFGNLHAAYRYDPLQRIKSARYEKYQTVPVARGVISPIPMGSTPTAEWASDYSYDKDGNLTKLRRMGNAVSSNTLLMDSLAYFYDAGTNRLRNVQDYSSTTAYQTDIPYNVGDTNLALYTYDLNGQLTKDVLGGVSSVSWNRFGKVEGMSKADGSSLSFDYDGLGHRVSKTYERRPSPDSLVISKTVYVRDAAGNPLAVYEDRKEYDVSRLTIEDMMATPVRTVMGGDIAPPLDWVKGVSRRLVKAYHSDTTANLAVLLVGLPQLADYVRDREAVGSLVSKLDQGQLRTFVQTMPDVVGYALGGKTIAGEGEAVVGKEVYGASLSTYLEPVFLSVGMRPWQQAVLLAVREADGSEGDVFRWFCSQLGVSDSAVAGFPGDTAVLSAFNNLGWEERYGITKGLSELLVQQRGVLPDTVRSALVSAYGRGNSHVDFIKDLPWSGRVYEQLGKDADIYIAHRYDLRDGGLLDAATVTGPFENNGVLLSALSRQGTFPLEVEDEALVETVLGADVDKVISLAKGAGQGEVLRDAFANEFGRSGWLDAWYAEQQVLFRDRVFLSEHHLYGSSRLGMQKYLPTAVGYEPRPVSGAYAPNRLVQPRGWYSRVGEDVFVGNNYNGTLGQSKVWQSGDTFTRRHLLGHRHYELSDHLGNVRATVLDEVGYGKWQSVLGNGGQPVSSLQPAFVAQVSSATDYHPFGMPMSGRSYGDSVKRCVPVSWQVWLEEGRWGFLKGIDGLSGSGNGSGSGGSTGKKVGAKTRRYGTEAGSEDSLGYLGGGVCFGDEVLQVYHTRERSSSDPVVETYNTEADGDRGGVVQTVGYKVDLTGEPQGGVRLFLGIPLDSVGDRQSVQLKYRMGGLGNSLEEDVVAQVRVRQYRSSGGSDYETALGWRNVEGNGEQVLDIPVDSYRVAGKGRTYVEWRFAKRGGGSGVFVDKGIDLRNVRMEELKVGWYTKTVYSCEEEDNYRFGYNTQEKVNEVSGKGNHYTAPYWEYDPRTGRRWNLDPKPIVGISNYSAFTNNPILYNDPNGDIIVFDKSTTTQFRKDFIQAATHLVKHGQVKEIAQLYYSPKVYVIKETVRDVSRFIPDRKSANGGGTVEWNPLIGVKTNNDKKLSPTTVLNHEFDHAAEWDKNSKGMDKNSRKDNKNPYEDKEEQRVITGSEQRTAKALGEIKEGEVTRKDHGAKGVIDTDSPTSTEGTERKITENIGEVTIKAKRK